MPENIQEIPDDSALKAEFESCARLLRISHQERNSRSQLMYYLTILGPLEQKNLQNVLNLKRATISQLLSSMEEEGVIVRKCREDDKRQKLVELTKQGKAAFKILHNQEKKNATFSVLSPSEKENLYAILKKLHTDWEINAKM